MKKRILSLFLALVMVVGLVPAFAISTSAATDAVKVEHNGTTTYYANLQKAFDGFAPSNNSYGGKYVVTLLADTTGVSKNLQYPTAVLDVTLDLNGHTITGPSGSSTTVVNINFGSKNSKDCVFTIKDSSGDNSGKITGGKNGVIFAGTNSIFNFEGGTITGNHGSTVGGGIKLGGNHYFNMTGGVITGNSVTGTSMANTGLGGGIYGVYMNITGGEIYGNTATGGTGKYTGRGGGICTDQTGTAGYHYVNIGSGAKIYGNTATNAGDDVMIQKNSGNSSKMEFHITTENWYIDGMNGQNTTSTLCDRYDAENPVPYTDGGWELKTKKAVGLKYVAPVAALPEAPDSENDFTGQDPFMFDCQDDIYAGVFFYYFVPEYATASEVYEEGGEYFVDITWNVKAFWESIKSWWDGSNGCGVHSLVDETVGYEVFTAKWNAESDKWEYQGDYIRYYITCASSVAPTAPDSYDDFANSPFTYRCEVKDENGNYPTVAANNFEKDYCASGDVYENNGEYFCDITWNMKKLWEEVDKPWFDSYVTYIHVGDHQPVEEFLEDKVFTAKWNGEKWEYVDEDAVYYVTCVTAPVAPNVNNVRDDTIYVFVCNTKLPDGQFHQSIGITFDTNYFEAGEPVKNADGEWIAEVTANVKAMWDNYISNIYEINYPDYAHTPEELPEELTFTLTWDSVAEEWVYGGELFTYDISCPKVAPELPKDNGSNVTDELITIICDTDADHTEKTYGWADPAANFVFPEGSTPVWDDALGAWTIGVRIDSIETYYANLRFSEEYNDIQHEIVGEGRIDTTLVWNETTGLWDTLTGEPFEVHVTCQDEPVSPEKGFMLSKFQIKVVGNVAGEEKVWFSTLDYDTVTIGEVYGNREDGFYADVTVTLENDDVYLAAWIEKHASELPAGTFAYDWSKTENTVTFTLKYIGDTTGELYDGPQYWDADGETVYTAYVAANAPAAPDKYGNNVTPDLIRVICDTDTDHAPINIKWQHQSTKVRDWVSGVVWSDEYDAWIVPIRIDSVSVYYVWANFEKENNDIVHDLVDEDQICIDTYLKWDEDKELWVTLDEKPIDVHVTCKTEPTAPTAFQVKNYQIKVTGIVDGEEKVYFVYVDTANAIIGNVIGSRENGFTVDVTFPITEDDALEAGWIEKRDPDATVDDYTYDWTRTENSITITLEYTGGLVSDLYGNRVGDWALANGMTYGTIGEAYLVPAKPASPKQENVTDKLVAIICDSDADRHAPVFGKWYPQHCKTTSEITWNEELSAWTVDVRIGSLYIMYVDQLEDANGGTIHELVDDITTVYATLVWNPAEKLWVPEEDIELHTTCRTAPIAPEYRLQLEGYQVKVYGDVNGTEKAWTTSIPEDGYTLSEVYGSREEGFFVDVTFTIVEDDIYQSTWIEKRNPGYYYDYDWDKTPTEVTFTLEYNGDLNGTLYGDRHASNTNYDWVLETNGKTYGVVAEAYLEQVKESVRIVIYRNGNTTEAYKTVSLGKIAKGETITLSEYDIADYYENELGFEFYGWYNDGAWNQYKAGKNPAALETITVNGWTNIICMVYDYEEVVVKAVVDGDKENAEELYTGKVLFGTNVVEWLTANVTVEDRIGYTLDKWFSWDTDAKIADDATVAGATAIYVTYTANEYTITFNTDGGSEVAPITQLFGRPVSAPANPTKVGHTFTGWVREDGSAFSFDGYTMEAASFTLKATWKANTYSVTLVPNGGRINSGNVTEYTYGIGATLPTDVTRLGYKFLGWYDNPEFKGERVWKITETDIGDKVYFAKWELKTLPIIPSTYDVYVANSIKGGTVSVNKTTVPAGVSVRITVDPNSGFELTRLTVTTTRGQNVVIKQLDETTYKFTMPACDVVVDAAFTETVVVDTGCKRDETCPMYSFTDLDTYMWYHDGIHYCLENGLMEGYGNNIFKPDAETTRAMIVTILWRLEGSPKVDYKMTFKDVEAGMWYTDAIRWAASEGIVLGYDEDSFGPDDAITREQLATILYRYEKFHGGGFTGLWMFKLDYVDAADVSDWAYEAMCWMTMNKIVQGKNDNVLDPQGGATRAEAATMLYRYCTKEEK